eukprot:scaffold53813_cov83-Cyclotella_meneghiniana.AAC.3
MKCVVGDYFVRLIGGGVVACWMRDHCIWEEGVVTVCINRDGCLVSDPNALIRWYFIEVAVSNVSVVESRRCWNSLMMSHGMGYGRFGFWEVLGYGRFGLWGNSLSSQCGRQIVNIYKN